ncbi:MAG TPA: hypothetical protein VII87_00835 [Solirubrobacteraceae bacterium]
MLTAPHLPLPEQRQSDVGQIGQVAGAQRAERTRKRRQAAVESADEPIEQLRSHAGVAEQQPQGIALTLIVGHAIGPHRPDAGGYPVELLAGGQPGFDGLASGVVARLRLGRDPDRRSAAGDAGHALGGERGTVEDQWWLGGDRHGAHSNPARKRGRYRRGDAGLHHRTRHR